MQTSSTIFPFLFTVSAFIFPIPFSIFLVSSLKKHKSEIWKQEVANIGSQVSINQGQDSLRFSFLFSYAHYLVTKWPQEPQSSFQQDTGRKKRGKG